MARGSGVDGPVARPSAECSCHPEEILEIRSGQLHCPWICGFPPLGSRTEGSQAVVCSNCFVGFIFGIDPHRMDYFVLLDFLS
jgi:hypothetical protein